MNNDWKQFVDFLASNGAVMGYFREAYKHVGVTDLAKHITTLAKGNSKFYLDSAFSWCSTSEGYTYWDALDDKWMEELTSE